MPDHYTRLLEWRREEAATRGLHKLPSDFYTSTESYLAETRATFEAELRSNPGGRKGDLARQTYLRAAQVARDIVESRMMKVLTLAFQSSVGSGRDLGNALPPERQLYEALAEALRGHRRKSAPYLETASAPPSPVGDADPAPTPAAAARSAPTAPRAREPPALTVVRVLKDGRPVELGGETIDLRKEDLLSLPEETARLLIDAKVAERVATGSAKSTT